MAAPFKFELVSPERLLLSAEVTQVDLPGTEGDFGVLAGHAPFVATLRPGIATVTKSGGEVVKIFVRGGLADVSPAGLTVLAEKAIPVSEMKADQIAAEIAVAETAVANAIGESARQAAALKLAQLKDLVGSLKAA
ncbi:F0F1 ATP synthase subunit epsilon [Methylobrevis albus]|uniref:ATP synthase epsilon chain n=1 Tax=Methylobrevis albus TaxID=2793297 RepID=A0A931I1G9_9HYPH|nr:F0F1 ATP synthase subunit epsilon [Methylobrevis albus]MBH0238062.1 F0F1 ATP synthase subunit epsilon [Methylobrevis albus]